jgi:hypothetical protein
MAKLFEDNLDRSQVSPSSPEFIDLDDITRLDDSKFTTPLTGSLIGVSTQPGTVEELQRTNASNPLIELIKIYDDDERPKVSLVTPVHIKEKNGPEKTHSHVPDIQIL